MIAWLTRMLMPRPAPALVRSEIVATKARIVEHERDIEAAAELAEVANKQADESADRLFRVAGGWVFDDALGRFADAFRQDRRP